MSIKIVHIINYDEKFFDRTLTRYESDSRFVNYPIVVVSDEEQLQTLGDVGHNAKVMVKGKELKSLLQTENYEAVLFHSLPPRFWQILNYIPKDKTIIWWAWGYDIYSSVEFSHPFIPILELKTVTRNLFRKRNNVLKQSAVLFRNLIQGSIRCFMRNKVLKRIDYFEPVIGYEYELMKRYHPIFHAKEYYHPNKLRIGPLLDEKNRDDGNILLGNSATYSNNHLDVWRFLKGNYESDQKVIIPISYGDKKYANVVANEIIDTSVILLKEMLPREDYFALMDSCSFMVMGAMRQQAMGNVTHAIRNGVKVFLFRDSVVYQHLNRLGLKVFAIEDINQNSFKTALSLEEANSNILMLNKEAKRRTIVLEEFFENLFAKDNRTIINVC